MFRALLANPALAAVSRRLTFTAEEGAIVFKRDPGAAGGVETSKLGTASVRTTYSGLVDAFGEPDYAFGDPDDKSHFEWDFMDSDSNVYTIYDWKVAETPEEIMALKDSLEPIVWNIGGSEHADGLAFEAWATAQLKGAASGH